MNFRFYIYFTTALTLATNSVIAQLQSSSTVAPAPIIYFSKVMPGVAQCVKTANSVCFTNSDLQITWSFAGGKLQMTNFTDVTTQKQYPQAQTEAFRLGVEGVSGLPATKGFVPANLSSSDFKIKGSPQVTRLTSDRNAARLAERFGGWRVSAVLENAASGMEIDWSSELRDGSNYVIQTITIKGTQGQLSGIQVLDFKAAGAKQIGTATAGNPVATDSLFFGMELPMGKNDLANDQVQCGIDYKLPLNPTSVYSFSSVIGTYPKDQMRRAFLSYIERERAKPYAQFLHYNGWFDFDRNVNEKGMIDTIEAYNRELITKRGVPVKAFVIDDGWFDSSKGFWTVDRKKFPNDFKSIVAELTKIGSRFGIWISPLGGYENTDRLIAQGAKLGLVRNGSHQLDLSYAPYYKWFLDRCTEFIKQDRDIYFKFDKAGSGVSPHFLALLRICDELHKIEPNLVINVTVGTWPSPFWLNHIDCTWRDGNDMGFEGAGNEREKWITYRDAQTWRGVVSKAPLYPLNSIMVHGIVLSDGHPFARQALKGGTDLKHEARSFFGSGTMMQELYVKPSITPQSSWDELAESAKWSAANADVLVDTHWVGDNPANGEIYGWASWNPRKGLLTLRNPSDSVKTFTFDVGKIFQLPNGAPTHFTVKSAYADTPAPIKTAAGGEPDIITLKPFEVLVLEFTPTR